jgi:hypothetical protein
VATDQLPKSANRGAKNNEDLRGWIICWLVAFFTITLVIVGVYGLATIMGVPSTPLAIYESRIAAFLDAFGYVWLLFPVGGAYAVTRLYEAYRHNRLRKTHITVWHFVCRHCEMQWTVRREPTARKLS